MAHMEWCYDDHLNTHRFVENGHSRRENGANPGGWMRVGQEACASRMCVGRKSGVSLVPREETLGNSYGCW